MHLHRMCSHQFAFNAESPAIVFGQRLDWDVEISGDMEMDEFDALHPAYLMQRASDNSIQGCVRMLPSTGAVHPRHYAAAGAAMLARLS